MLDFARWVFDQLRNALTILLLFSCVANAQTGPHPLWALHYYGGKSNNWHDQPDCGPLEKFRGDPKTFDYDYDLFGIEAPKMKDDVKAERIGQIAGFTVYDVMHNIDTGTPGTDLTMKMIIVERMPGEFCEIFQQEYAPDIVFATSAYFINAGEQVLATTDHVSGTGGYRIEAYWAFDKDGPVPLDLSQIEPIVRELLPAGYSLYGIPYFFGRGLSFENLACTRWNGKFAAGPCVSVRIDFEVKDHKLTATSKSVVPSRN
jgi:hypothetical protein